MTHLIKRMLGVAAVLAVLVPAAAALAHDSHSMASMSGGKPQKSVTGELVDMGCYLGHAARGEKHVSCATKCINQGMPMGVLTSTGTLYLVTLDHGDYDPYTQLKAMAGKNVTVTGAVLARSGMNAIEASKVQLAGK